MKKLIMMTTLAMATAQLCGVELSDKEAQVYDIKVTIKTTVAKSGKLSPKKNPFVSDTDTVVYRSQGSQTWTGVIWGCDCETLLGAWKTIGGGSEVVAGVAIWNSKKPYNIVFLDDMKWRVLNAIEAAGGNVEVAWTIGDSSDASNAFLAFAGFGKLDVNTSLECRSIIKSLSGNVAGWMPAPKKVTPGNPGICTFCSGLVGETPDTEEFAVAWVFCPCETIGDTEFTAVSGTWTLKYNNSLSKKLTDQSSILDVYTKFPSNVKTAVASKIAEVSGKGE